MSIAVGITLLPNLKPRPTQVNIYFRFLASYTAPGITAGKFDSNKSNLHGYTHCDKRCMRYAHFWFGVRHLGLFISVFFRFGFTSLLLVLLDRCMDHGNISIAVR